MLLRKLRTATDTFTELLVYYFGLLLACAAAYSLFEKASYWDSFYWAVVSALTIGYGDMYPKTVGGRITLFVLIHVVSLIILPLIVARMATKMIADRDRFTHAEQEEIKQMLHDIQAHQINNPVMTLPAGGLQAGQKLRVYGRGVYSMPPGPREATLTFMRDNDIPENTPCILIEEGTKK